MVWSLGVNVRVPNTSLTQYPIIGRHMGFSCLHRIFFAVRTATSVLSSRCVASFDMGHLAGQSRQFGLFTLSR